MKKILLAVTIFVFLSGCASQAFRAARDKANLVTNGMSVAQASELLGMQPTHRYAGKVVWRPGDTRPYDGTMYGAIEFNVVDGKIVDVPDGGIFSKAARDLRDAEWKRKQDLRNAELTKEEEMAEAKRMRERAARLEQIAAEAEAAGKAAVLCNDKVMCGKVFALAQIYVREHADQKIQVATDTIIETYNPTSAGSVGITVIKMPGAGTVEMVKITPSCKAGTIELEDICRDKRTAIYRGFKPFIERSLSM